MGDKSRVLLKIFCICTNDSNKNKRHCEGTIGIMVGYISLPIVFCLFINDLVAYLRTELMLLLLVYH